MSADKTMDDQNPNRIELIGWRFDNTYAAMPEALSIRVLPAKFPKPQVIMINFELAKRLGLELGDSSQSELAEVFAGQLIPSGADPIAQAYAGHQFGGFTMLGDGRAILLGEQIAPDGARFDIQFKGSGETPFSRRGDGKAALGPMLREYIISEAMAGLGIPTTRCLAVVTTGEPVYRETVLRGAVLTRIALSHIRVGTFQYLAAREDIANLRVLADYTINRHYPELHNLEEKYLAFLQAVIDRQAALIAQWQSVGFIHGVMNTDNMAISGETIDYGPCAFMDHYHADTVFSSIDDYGRYAYSNQPKIAQWNLARFAETLLPLLHDDRTKAIQIATDAVVSFGAVFEKHWLTRFRHKLGLLDEKSEDAELVGDLLSWMQSSQSDFTNTFRELSLDALPDATPYQDPHFAAWRCRWKKRLEANGQPLASSKSLMLSANPAIIPRNHLVEEALALAHDEDDLSLVHELLDVLRTPFESTLHLSKFTTPPPIGCGYRTFCGT